MQSKLVHSIIGFFISIGSASYSWFQLHGNSVATGIAIVAGLYSIKAARETIALRKAQKDELNIKRQVTIRHIPNHPNLRPWKDI